MDPAKRCWRGPTNALVALEEKKHERWLWITNEGLADGR